MLTSKGRTVAGFAILIAGTIGMAASVVAAELKIAHFMSPRHPMDRAVMRPLAEALEKATDGALTARIYPAGELGKGPVQQYKRAVTGVADIVFGIPAYTPTQFTRTTLVHIPGLFADPANATETIWSNIDLFSDDFAAVKLLALWTNNPAILITKDKPVRSVADVKGMKIRAPNPVAVKMIESWGGVPVSLPINKAYNAMSTGVVDAIMVGPSAIGSFKLHEVAKHITVNLPTAVDSFYLIMNKGAWDGLSDAHKAVVEDASGKTMSLDGAAAYKAAGDSGLALAKEKGVEIIALGDAEVEAFRKAMDETLTTHIADTGKEESIPAADIVGALSGKTM